jgi:hypothetical protein
MTMKDEQTQPMTAEEYYNTYMEGKNSVNIYRFAEAYHNYRLEFEKQQQPKPADPYYTDPATWPEWANWRAVGEDGCVYFSSILMEANTLYGSWSTSIYAASKMVPRAVTHNPNWRNSLRSREEVSGGK